LRRQAGQIDKSRYGERLRAYVCELFRIGDELRLIAGNDECADCGAPAPKWCSISLAVTLCVECAAIHRCARTPTNMDALFVRSFGVFVSKVRSLYLDALEPEHVAVLRALGNVRVNSVYLAALPLIEREILPPRARADSTR
jgi:hypothetical protein